MATTTNLPAPAAHAHASSGYFRGAGTDPPSRGFRASMEPGVVHTLHFTPTSESWLDLVEVFFSIITRQAIRRGSYNSVKDLIAAIERFITGWNDRCQPFVWTKTADELLDHCRPGQRASFTRH